MWAAKCIAAIKHGMVTLVVAITTYVLVFHVWYPDIFSQLMPGAKLFLLMLAVEVVLGPCMSLVVFNPAKSRRELIVDYTLICAIQLSALVYGVFTVVDSRPVYIVFVKDRLEIVSAVEIGKADLLEASIDEFKKIPWWGPRFICTRSVSDTEEKKRLLFEEIPVGKDVQHLPRFYRECKAGEIAENGFKLAKLESIFLSKGASDLKEDLTKLDGDKVWLPIIGKTGVWVALLDPSSTTPESYIKFDPF